VKKSLRALELPTALPHSSGAESDDPAVCGRESVTGIVALDPFVHQEMRHCYDCAGPQIFLPMYEIEIGRVGVCLGCGRERIERFSRTVSEAA